MLRVLVIAALPLCTSSCSSVQTVAEVHTYDVVPNKQLQSGVSYYLPKNLIRIHFVRSAAAGPRATASDSIGISIEPAVADTRYRFTVKGVHLASHDSRFHISVTDRGLLSFVTAKVQDRLPEITANISRAAIAASTGFPPGPATVAASQLSELVMDPLSDTAGKTELSLAKGVDEASSPDDGVNNRGKKVLDALCQSRKAGEPANVAARPDEDEEAIVRRRARYRSIVCRCRLSVNTAVPTEAKWIIDPSRYSSVLSVNCELQKLGSNLRVRVLRWPDARESYKSHRARFAATSHEGVVYRAPTDYKVAIVELRKPVGSERRQVAPEDLLAIVREEHNFVLPNGGPIRTLPFRYSMCSVAGYQVQFVDGMPVRQQIDHRSELAACSAIPLQIISDIIEAPIKMFEFETRRIEKQKGFEDAKRQLDESRKLPGPSNP